jgi:hypothetical protein
LGERASVPRGASAWRLFRRIEQLTNNFEAKLAAQQKQIEALIANLKERVPHMVLNSQ